jgi:hypothetical protein
MPHFIAFLYDSENVGGKPYNFYCNLIIPSDILAHNRLDYNKYQNKVFPTKSISVRFFNEKINGGYDI